MEGTMQPTPEAGVSASEKRSSPRVAFPAELIVVWRDAGGIVESLRMRDVGFGGLRLASSTATAIGRIGRAVHILPDHTQVDRDILVVWSVQRDDGGSEFGVRFLESF